MFSAASISSSGMHKVLIFKQNILTFGKLFPIPMRTLMSVSAGIPAISVRGWVLSRYKSTNYESKMTGSHCGLGFCRDHSSRMIV